MAGLAPRVPVEGQVCAQIGDLRGAQPDEDRRPILPTAGLPAVSLYQQVDLYGVTKRLSWKARSDEVLQAMGLRGDL
jgi:hypothetical protein